jgi:hypothetical protein
MQPSKWKDQREARLGRAVERAISHWLMSRCGGFILPAYDYSSAHDRAPLLLGVPDSLISPDLLYAQDGETSWLECKFKTHADFTRITEQFETGIPLRHWRHYLRVREVTGLPVWLLFAHWKEAEVRGQELGELDRVVREYRGQNMPGGEPMAFFPWDDLLYVATTAETGVDAALAEFNYVREAA